MRLALVHDQRPITPPLRSRLDRIETAVPAWTHRLARRLGDATMTTQDTRAAYAAMETAAELLGARLEPYVEPGPGEPGNASDFTRLATVHTFGDAWPRTEVLDLRTRALISVTIAAALGTLEPLRGQLRIALHNGVSPEQIVETFIQIEAYAGAARAFDGYRIAREVFAERSAATS
jgi:4-carboxymuconolactone decarboxylase